MSDHSVVGASKNKPTEPDDPVRFYKCCKCFATEFVSSNEKVYHKVCCYVYTADGKSWVGSYDYKDKDIDVFDDLGWPSPDDIWCCCCRICCG